ncbi:MAG TPA: UDP-3-O-(3-hydroxymyristoyl)glucosamine N-acyltransferase [Rhizomicrobium sp.]|nr:UDP-3-O-(3-hydroxymyristoyl)glucosamine N-acyltransferase [Rhizomicrobium sp.]
MADPRFYDNCGPFPLAELCAQIGAAPGPDADPDALVTDVATLDGASAGHLAFCATKAAARTLTSSQAGFCIVDKEANGATKAPGMTLLSSVSAAHAFAAAARLFYPAHNSADWSLDRAVHPTARLGAGVELAPGAIVGPGAEIGERTRIGPNTVVGRGVAIGRDCEIAGNVTLGHALLGDRVQILPGVQIGQPGFGFASGAAGHVKIPQLGRVIVQDDVEIGACTTIDRGALGDTVIGEGTKIDNLVQIGHNTRTGRHCIIVAQSGISGSCELGDFVVLGGQAGVADHVRLGEGARVAAKSGLPPGDYPGGQDYGGYPVRLAKDWRREVAALVMLAKRRKQDRNG